MQEGIQVQVAQTARIDVVLKVGATSETVTVEANAPLLRTESAEQSQTFTGDTIDQLPLTLGGNNLYGARNPLASLTLAPGTSQVVGTNFQFRVNGATDQARYLLDGQDITTQGMNSQHLSESHPSVEALQEVTLQSSNFAAEFGQVRGGLVNFTTRSGTNQLHGSAYDYYTNEFLNAGRPFTDNGNGQLIRPRQRNNDYGFTLGGPVYLPKLYDGRNRTFFFFNFDQFRNRSVVSGAAATVPSDAYRSGDFSAALTGRVLGTDPQGRPILENMIYDPTSNYTFNGQVLRNPFPGNVINPNMLDPVALKVQALIPTATRPGILNNLAVVDQTASTTTLPSIKIDELLSAKTKVSFYFGEWINDVPKSTGDGIPFPISNTREFITHNYTYRFTLDQTLTPTLLLHLGLGEVRYNHIDSSPDISQNYDAPGKLGLNGGVKNAQGNTGFPGISGLSSSSGGGFSSPNGTNIGWTNGVHDWDDKPTINAGATLVRGNHTYKAGMEWHKDVWTFTNFVDSGRYSFSAAETGLPYLQSTTLAGGGAGLPVREFPARRGGQRHHQTHQRSAGAQIGLGPVRAGHLEGHPQAHARLRPALGLPGRLARTAQPFLLIRPVHSQPGCRRTAGSRRLRRLRDGTLPVQLHQDLSVRHRAAPGSRVPDQQQDRDSRRLGVGLRLHPVLSYFTTATVGVGFNTLTFSNSAFGDPTSYLRDGLQYNPALLTAASYDPGVKPEPGTINSPPSFLDPSGGRPPRVNQWNISLQREIVKDLVVEAAYVGNRSAWILGNNSQELNALSPQMLAQRGFDISNAADRSVLTSLWTSPAAQARGIRAPYAGYPTGLTVAQTLRPYPQFGNIGNQWVDTGKSWYDSLQVKVTKRYSRGLQVTTAFTWQKEQDYGINQPNNVYNADVNKGLSAYSQPFVLAIGATYQTPALKMNRVIRSIARDWTIGTYLTYSSGLPIESPCGQNNLQTLLFQSSNGSISSGQNSAGCSSGTFMNRKADVPLFLKDLNCHCIDPNKDFVLNPAAWESPAAGQFGTAAAYYNDYRFQRHPIEQISIGRVFPLHERMRLEIRAELFNVFNRANMADPISVNSLASQQRNAQGVPISGFGYINSQSLGNGSTLNNNTGLGNNPRQGQLLARFTF